MKALFLLEYRDTIVGICPFLVFLPWGTVREDSPTTRSGRSTTTRSWRSPTTGSHEGSSVPIYRLRQEECLCCTFSLLQDNINKIDTHEQINPLSDTQSKDQYLKFQSILNLFKVIFCQNMLEFFSRIFHLWQTFRPITSLNQLI